MIKVLVLLTKDRLPNNDFMYDESSDGLSFHVVKLDSIQQKNLSRQTGNIDFSRYDFVVFDLLFKRIYRQISFFRRFENPIFLEIDACQDNIPSSKWYGKFEKFYKSLNSPRLILSGFKTANYFKNKGFNAVYLQKGFDENVIFNENLPRDVELGFVGRYKSKTYSERKKLIQSLQGDEGLEVLRSEPGKDYREMLSRIRFFLSADIGLNEYMAKNYEAMACGCVLFAFKQGDGEEEAQGLVDMFNVVLYEDIDDLKRKLKVLRNDARLASLIAANGQKLVYERYTFSCIGERLSDFIRASKSVRYEKPFWMILKEQLFL